MKVEKILRIHPHLLVFAHLLIVLFGFGMGYCATYGDVYKIACCIFCIAYILVDSIVMSIYSIDYLFAKSINEEVIKIVEAEERSTTESNS